MVKASGERADDSGLLLSELAWFVDHGVRGAPARRHPKRTRQGISRRDVAVSPTQLFQQIRAMNGRGCAKCIQLSRSNPDRNGATAVSQGIVARGLAALKAGITQRRVRRDETSIDMRIVEDRC
jgi:hypothetical protein